MPDPCSAAATGRLLGLISNACRVQHSGNEDHRVNANSILCALCSAVFHKLTDLGPIVFGNPVAISMLAPVPVDSSSDPGVDPSVAVVLLYGLPG